MTHKDENYTKRISFRVTQSEFDRLEKEFKKSAFFRKSDFLRAIYAKHKASKSRMKEWEAIIKAGKLSNELNRVGVNFNQLTKKINEGLITSISKREKAVINEIANYVYEVIKILSKTKI